MPYNNSARTFQRVWKFLDEYRVKEPATRAAFDTAFDDLKEGIDAALRELPQPSREHLENLLSEFSQAPEGVTYTAGGRWYKKLLGSTSLPRLPGLAPAWKATPEHFGMDEAAADNSEGLAAALAYDGRIEWGDGTYRFSTPQNVSRTSSVRWESGGCRLVYEGPATQRAIQIEADGHDFGLDGDFVVDAGLKAFDALYVVNSDTGPRPVFSASGLRVENPFRSSTDHSGGNGIWIRGGWRKIYLERPTAFNCRMAAGAGVFGSQGIFGITISAGERFPDEITIISPEVSEVFCDDDTYTYDQDGIRIFTEDDDPDDPMVWPTHFTILGGRLHNCRGRSIKSQCEMGTVIGTKFVRDKGFKDAQGNKIPGNDEVDFQVGGGMMFGCEYHYTDYCPNSIVGFRGTQDTGNTGRLSSGGSLTGARVFMKNTPVMPSLVFFRPYAAPDFTIEVKDLQVVSNEVIADCIVSGSMSDTTGDENIRIDGFLGRLGTHFVRMVGTGAAVVSLRNATNLASPVPVLENVGGDPIRLHTSNVLGATDATQTVTKVDGIDWEVTGTVRASLDDDGNLTLLGNNPQVILEDSAGATGAEAVFQNIDGSTYVYADRTGVAGGASVFDVRIGGSAAGDSVMTLKEDKSASFKGPVLVANYSTATVPSASDNPRGLIYVNDGAAGSPVIAFSNGTNWLRCDTLAAISSS